MKHFNWSKHKCLHCGHVIRYSPDDVATMLVCPKCESKSPLPERRPGDSQPPSTGPCSHRPASLLRYTEPCEECAAEATQRRQKIILTVTGIALIVIILLGIGGLLLWKYLESTEPKAVVLPQPQILSPAATIKSLENLAAGRFAVQQDGTNMIISGDVHNLSEHLHRNVTAYLDVFNARGQKIGEVSNAIVELGPKSIWRLIAKTTDTNAISARWSRFSEKP